MGKDFRFMELINSYQGSKKLTHKKIHRPAVDVSTAAFQRQAVNLGDGTYKELFGGINCLDFHVFDFIVIIKLGKRKKRKISYSMSDNLAYQCARDEKSLCVS